MALTARRQADKKLVDRCLQRQKGAWEDLDRLIRMGLWKSIADRLGPEKVQRQDTDEIIQSLRVALWEKKMARLRRYDPEHGGLLPYLKSLALQLMIQHWRWRQRFRLEKRLKEHFDLAEQGTPDWEIHALLDEALPRLTSLQREYYQECIEGGSQRQRSACNERQLRHRISTKVHELCAVSA